MDVVFTKTSKGIEEMEKRTAGLTPRVRRVLIMIDGKRTMEALSLGTLARRGLGRGFLLGSPHAQVEGAPKSLVQCPLRNDIL